MRRNVENHTLTNAKTLRHDMTPAERVLWNKLRMKQMLGLKVRRQHSISKYIVDFYIEECRLVIELDGESHHYRTEKDEIRTEYLIKNKYKVIRFQNKEIFQNLDHVLEVIYHECFESIQPPSNSPQTLGGG